MSDWEFLLQKEGDQSWLPLESADVEILEGRYRIVANTHIANTEVQIRIIHNSTEEIPPVRRAHKRSSHTHSQGLISIIPFTRLKPGKWEFHCQAKLSTSTDQHIVHLEVLPTDYDTPDFGQQLEEQSQELYAVGDSGLHSHDLINNEHQSFFSSQIDTNQEQFESDEIELLDAQIQDESESLEESKTIENVTDLLDSDEQSQENLTSQNQEFKDTENQLKKLTETLIKNSLILEKTNQTQNQEIELEGTKELDTRDNQSSTNYPLELILDRASYIVEPGSGLIISGQIIIDEQNQQSESIEGVNQLSLGNDLTNKDLAITEYNTPVVNGNLNICLRNPQTSEILVEVEQTLPEQTPPIIFACTINVPENIKTRLILGEIILTDGTNILANQSFTITAPLENLLAVIDHDFVEDEHQGITEKTTLARSRSEQKPPSFQELVEKINETQVEEQANQEQPLPPQIYQPVTNELNAESLTLPTFGNPLPDNLGKNAQINDLLAKSTSANDTEKNDDVWQDVEQSEEKTILASDTQESESETVNLEEAANTKQNLVPFPTQYTTENKAFKDLNLEDRFFSRLNSLINDTELLQWMKASSVPPTEATEQSIDEQKNQIEKFQDNDSIVIVDDEELASDNNDVIDWEAREFVVEDEEQPAETLSNQNEQWDLGLGNLDQQQEQPISTQPYVLPDEQPVPVPHLEVLGKDVIAGRTTKVRVQLPEGLPRIYVKIWVYDRQAQTIVAGPRWLTDFIPNGTGEIEVITELDIAYGCLEIKFEAIAAEVQTNRESHKAVIERLVLPPPPPKLPFDDLS
ncbi:MAG: hypothetical protein AB4080_01830 [Trichodesmium sp.]